MSSFFKPKRSSADSKSSSKSSHVTEPDPKTQKSISSTPSSKSGAVHGPPSANAGGGAPPNSKQTPLANAGGVAPNSKQAHSANAGGGMAPNSKQASSANAGGVAPNSKQTPTQAKERKASMDMQEWLETECPIDSRMMAATMTNNTLSISRSGRFKAKGKMRARLFSEDADGVPQDDHPTQAPRSSTSLATPEDRQTVLDAMAKRAGAATPVRSPTAKQGPAGGNQSNQESGANRKSADRGSSSNWSTTPNSTDL